MILLIFLNTNPPPKDRTFKKLVSTFDFLGLFLVVSGVVCLLVGFNHGQVTCTSFAIAFLYKYPTWLTDYEIGSDAESISLLTVGGVLLVLCAINEVYTTRSPIIPPRLFKTRTTAIILVSVFLHALPFFAGAYYLPLYFQILGSSATLAGVQMLPYSLGSALFSILSGFVVAKTGDYRITMWVAWVSRLFDHDALSPFVGHTLSDVLFCFIRVGCVHARKWTHDHAGRHVEHVSPFSCLSPLSCTHPGPPS